MDVDNVKLPWNEILESYIKHYEQERPELNVRAQMSPIIDSLVNNRIRSRAIMNAGNAVCYAFYLSPESLSDRYYGLIGFVSSGDFNPDRLRNILSWLISEATRDHKILMFNDVFNAYGYEGILEDMGFGRIDRVMMTLRISDLAFHENIGSMEGIDMIPITVNDIPELVKMHETSFTDSGDSILESSIAVERNRFWVNLFEGKALGRFLSDSSMWIAENSGKKGAIITTLTDGEPLIVDIFVTPESRGKGLAGTLIRNSVSVLSASGYESVTLWVTKGNPAMELYSKLGFIAVKDKTETIFFRKC